MPATPAIAQRAFWSSAWTNLIAFRTRSQSMDPKDEQAVRRYSPLLQLGVRGQAEGIEAPVSSQGAIQPLRSGVACNEAFKSDC